jgi:hypothetical protein
MWCVIISVVLIRHLFHRTLETSIQSTFVLSTVDDYVVLIYLLKPLPVE